VANANNTIEKFDTNGVASVFAADPGDGSVLNSPAGLAFDQAGNLYVANNGNDTIEKFTANGVASVFVSGDNSPLSGPEGIAFGTNGALYVANDGNFIEEFPTNGPPINFVDSSSSYLYDPAGMAFDTNGNLYVANAYTAEYGPTIVKFDPAGNGSTFASTALDSPEYLAFDKAGNLYVANSGNSNNIVRFTPDGASSVVTNSLGNLAGPYGLAFDSSGNLFVGNSIGFIEELYTNGDVYRFATTSVAYPHGLAVDSKDNVYAANYLFGTVQKFATNGTNSVFAAYALPYGLAVDGADNLYVAYDYDNTIYKYTPNGPGGVFATSGLNNPEGLAVDSSGNLYASNSGTNIIARFDASGHFSVFATNSTSYGTFGPGLGIDSANNVYVLARPYSTTIVKFTPAGVSSNFASLDQGGNSWDDAQGMAFDSAGNLYVSDFSTGTIEKFDTNGNGSVFATGLNGPTAIAIRRTGSIAVRPRLSITKSGTNALISWTLATPNYTLQSNTNLAGTNWIAMSGTPGTNNGNYVLTNGITGSARFFRLKGN
jgi:DNA-binding beta-propeller fold protein YncE